MNDLHAFFRWLVRLPRDLARMALGRPPVPWRGLAIPTMAGTITFRGREILVEAATRKSLMIWVDGRGHEVFPVTQELASAEGIDRLIDSIVTLDEEEET